MAKFRNKAVAVEAAFYDGSVVGDRDAADPSKAVPNTCPDWFPALTRVFKPDEQVEAAVGDAYGIEGQRNLHLVLPKETVTAEPGDWIVKSSWDTADVYDLDVITDVVFQERFEPVPDIDQPDPDELEIEDAAGGTLTPLESPLDVGDIDIVSFAAVTAHMAAGQLYGLLTTEEGGMVPDWMGSRRGDIEADVNAFAGFLHAQRVDNAETLWIQSTGEGWIQREAARFAGVPFARRQAFLVFAEVAGKVLGSLGHVQELLELERKLAREAAATPPLAREDSIDPAPERLDEKLEGFEPTHKRGGFADPSKFDHDGDGKPGGSKPKPGKLSIGQTVAQAPVNRGGRGRRKSARDRKAKSAE